MGVALRKGIMQADARKNKVQPKGIKLDEFAKEFAAAYNG
jgi:hypothetical protein